MTNNTKPTAAKDGEKPGLMPKLRFLELRATGWIQKKLEDVAPLQRGFDLPSDLIRPGNIPIVYSNGIQKYHEVGMATAPGLVTGRSGTIGKLHFIESGDYWPHNTSLWVTSFNGNVPRFVFYLYDSIGMSRFSSGSGVPTLNRNDVHAFGVSIPSSSAEQQKIADCLSSLDELIAAQARKVDALKTHKKGLVQQLFPREGETQPCLRFPEFRHDGEWQERKAGSLFVSRTTKGEDGLPIYSVTKNDGMVKRNSLDRKIDDIEEAIGNKKVLQNDIAYNMMRMWQGALGVAPEDCLVSPAYVVLAPKKDTVPLFFQYMFKQPEMLLLLTAHSRGLTKDRLRLYFDDFARMEFRCPNVKEQQRIAEFLASLDALINSTTQKLEALKTHKKGLMQQLFPSVGGVAGEA